MTQASWPSPNYNTRNVTDGEYERIASRFSDDGIDGSPLDAAVVAAGTGLQVTVRANVWASVRGHAWTSGTTDVTLTVGANSSGSTRTDRVVLRLDRSTWDVTAVVLPGTPGAGAPALTRDDADTGLWEIPCAKVTVPNGATSVTVTREELYIGARVRPCTSTTRPAFPRRGEMAREVDTGKVISWNGTSWDVLHEDTGQLALGPGYSTWQPFKSSYGRKKNGWVYLKISVMRTGSTFTTGDPNGSKIATVPDELTPTGEWAIDPARVTSTGGVCRVEVRSDGSVWATEPTEDITEGRVLELSMTYIP